MSFGIGVGDILLLSKLAYRLAKTVTSDRKNADVEFKEVQNQLFAISNALNQLSNTLKETEYSTSDSLDAPEDETLGSMIENCRGTLTQLDATLKKYPVVQLDSKRVRQDDGDGRRNWARELKSNIKRIKWTTEGANLDKIRQNLAVHINALNLAIAARSCTQTERVETRIGDVQERLQDIHTWYLHNIKNAPKQVQQTPRQILGVRESQPNSSPRRNVQELTFFLLINIPNSVSTRLLCSKATFNPGWLQTSDLRPFSCICGSNHELDYTLLPVSIFVRLTMPRPTWEIFVSSREYNSAVSVLLTNIKPAHLFEFEQSVLQLAMMQGLRSTSAGVNSMLFHTSTQENDPSILSVLNTRSDVTEFQEHLEMVTIKSSGFQYSTQAIDSVQMLHYVAIPFSGSTDNLKQTNSGPLSCQSAEIILHMGTLSSDVDGSDITQLIVHFDHLTTVEHGATIRSFVLKGVKAKASFAAGEDLSIERADFELTFTSQEAADSYLCSLKALQKHLFVTYLRSQRLEEVIQFQEYVGDVMIRDMQLLNAEAILVLNTISNEQRMIIRSKCGSKSVTVVCEYSNIL
ncbi:hypothetical protein F5884DRAFT_549349 [Xylogone sp. PMI_703]|nr:hypothetical protein F5884DRAFT_549349 [Xylogone sp. PMI_703]